MAVLAAVPMMLAGVVRQLFSLGVTWVRRTAVGFRVSAAAKST
jgi:hypothetical protein